MSVWRNGWKKCWKNCWIKYIDWSDVWWNKFDFYCDIWIVVSGNNVNTLVESFNWRDPPTTTYNHVHITNRNPPTHLPTSYYLVVKKKSLLDWVGRRVTTWLYYLAHHSRLLLVCLGSCVIIPIRVNVLCVCMLFAHPNLSSHKTRESWRRTGEREWIKREGKVRRAWGEFNQRCEMSDEKVYKLTFSREQATSSLSLSCGVFYDRTEGRNGDLY